MSKNHIYSIDYTEIPLSGKIYRFDILNLSHRLPSVPAVYMISSFELIRKLVGVPYPYDIIALGITKNLQVEIKNHSSWNQWIKTGADMIMFFAANDIVSLQPVYNELATVYKDYNF